MIHPKSHTELPAIKPRAYVARERQTIALTMARATLCVPKT